MSDSHQPYVEDYDSVISEVVPLTRRTTVREKSGLSQSTTVDSSAFDRISDSGYSSHEANTPSNDSSETPPRKSHTPGPGGVGRKDSMKRASTPGYGHRAASKSFSRTASPAMPRNIPGPPRPRSQSITTGGADECDCSDCGKKAPSKPYSSSPHSPSAHGHWPAHQHSGSYSGSYGASPGQQWPSYAYPYEYPEYAGEPAPKPKRTSMPPPARPSSTFSGTATASYSANNYPYFSAPVPDMQAPPPSQTCPPQATYSPYAPPPLNTSLPPSNYAMPSPYDYSSSYTAPSPSYDYPPPPPPQPIPARRSSMRYETPPDLSYAPPARRSRPPSWNPQQFQEHSRSMSVPPPMDTYDLPAAPPRRKAQTPVQQMRRRDSTHSREHARGLGPSALSRAMESCAIEDEPRGHTRSQSQQQPDYYTYQYPAPAGVLARRGGGASESGSDGSGEGRMAAAGGRRRGASEGLEMDMRFVAARQQQVHAQLTGGYQGAVSYGGGGLPERRGSRGSAGAGPGWEYAQPPAGVYARRATMNGA